MGSSLTGNTMLRLFFIFSISLFFVSLFTQCTTKSQEVENDLLKLAQMINRQCPIKTDEIMRLDSCVVMGKELRCLYTITNDSAFNIQLFEEIGIPNIKDKLKTNPSLDFFRENQIKLKYEYRNRNSEPLYSFDIQPSEY